MIKVILKNFLRSIIMTVITVIPTVILTAGGHGALVRGLGFLPETVTTYYVMSCIFGGITSFFVWAVFFGKAEDWDLNFMNINCDGDDGYYKAVWVFLGLLIHLVLSAAAIVIMIFCKEQLNAHIQTNTNWIMVCCLLSSVAVFQAWYFVSTAIIYLGKYTCFYCGNIFSVERDSLISETHKDSTQYKSETNRRQVGSIYAGNTEVGKVYGDVRTDYSRDVHTIVRKYDCHCIACQKRFKVTETEKREGKWQ